MSKQILQAVKSVLCQTFPQLRPDHEVYLTPALILSGRVGQFELQIWEDGSGYEDPDGSVVTEVLQIGVGLILQSELNWSSRHGMSLEKIYDNVFRISLLLQNCLENNFLLDDTQTALLTRPLRTRQKTNVRVLSSNPLVLVREFGFIGGLISGRPTQ